MEEDKNEQKAFLTLYSLSLGINHSFRSTRKNIKRRDQVLTKERWGFSICVISAVIFLVGGLSPEAFGQAAQAVWTARYDGPPVNASDTAHSTVVDSAGNIYVTGAATSEWPASIGHLASPSFRSDWVTVKYDPAGNELWAARYEGLGAHSQQGATFLAADSAGNVYVSMASFTLNDESLTNYYITVKYDSAGTELWAARYGAPGGLNLCALAVDDEGNVYLAGGSYTSSEGTVLIKYDTSGNQLWVIHPSWVLDLAVDSTGNVYASHSSATIKYDPQGIELWTAASDGNTSALALDNADNVYVTGSTLGENDYDYSTVKYDPAGNELWTAIYDGPEHGEDRAHHLVVDSGSNVYVSGVSHGDLTGTDSATIKYDSAGNQLWVARYDAPGLYLKSLAVDGTGSIYILGSLTGANGKDYATVKYDSSGTELWTAVHDGPGHGDDSGHSLALDPAGNVVVTGEVFIDSMPPSYDHIDTDYGTIKYNSDGSQLWAVYKNNPAPARDCAVDAITDEAGNVYVTGPGSTVKYDAQGNQLWATSDGGYSMAVDTGGNVYVTHTEKGTLKYDPAGELLWAVSDNGYALVLDASGNVCVGGHVERPGTSSDFETRKYDSEGNILWTVWYNGPDDFWEQARLIDVDSMGNVYVAGYRSQEIVTLKYDPEGNELWAATYAGEPGDSDQHVPEALVVDHAGYAYITGWSGGDSHNPDYTTIKYDPEGNELWAARYNGPNDLGDFASAIGVDNAGNVYVTGNSGGYVVNYIWELTDYVTIKYDSAGNQLWVARYTGPLPTPFSDEIVTDMVVDPSGNVFVTGSTMPLLDLYNSDYATLKYNTNGQLIWAVTHDGSGAGLDQAASLALDSLGNVYVTGFTDAAATAFDYLTIKYAEALGWAPAATLPGTISAHGPASKALGWVFSLSIPLLALALRRRTWKTRAHRKGEP